MTLREGGGSGPGLPDLHRRFKWIALALALGFTMLIGRLWQLQGLRGDSYYERTRTNVVREHFLPAVRGKVFDRNGAPLADNRPAFNGYPIPPPLTPRALPDLVRLSGPPNEGWSKATVGSR